MCSSHMCLHVLLFPLPLRTCTMGPNEKDAWMQFVIKDENVHLSNKWIRNVHKKSKFTWVAPSECSIYPAANPCVWDFTLDAVSLLFLASLMLFMCVTEVTVSYDFGQTAENYLWMIDADFCVRQVLNWDARPIRSKARTAKKVVEQ